MIDNTSPIPLAIPPSIPAVPPNALILTVPPRPLVPFPIRPPGVQSGEMRTSNSDSDQNHVPLELSWGQLEVMKFQKLFKENK